MKGVICMNHRRTTRLTAVLLLLCLFVQTLPLASAKQFTDVSRNQLPDYFDAINYVSDNGIMNGVSATEFDPNGAVSRAMFITTLYRYAGSPSDYATVPFTDLPSSHWAYNAVRWGVKNNIVTGTTATTFEPDSLITREQAMTFLWRYLNNYQHKTPYYYGSITGCADYASITQYARTPMRWAVSNAIIFKSSNYIYPQSIVYRKELALWIMRFGQNVDGIRFGQDNFKFLNQHSSFRFATAAWYEGNSVYYYDVLRLSEKHYNLLKSAATAEEMKKIEIALKMPFGGVCFGMSLSALLDKKGIIDFNNNLSKNASTMYRVPAPSAQSANHYNVADYRDGVLFPASESAIHFYYLSQNIRSVIKLRDVNTQSANMYAPLIYALRTSGMLLVGYKQDIGDDTYAHAILLYGMPKVVGDYYEIACYDPNESTEQTVRVKTDGTAFYLADGTLVNRRLEYCADFYGFGKLDIDGEYNSTSAAFAAAQSSADTAVAATADTEQAKQIWISVDADSSCTVTNAEGEVLTLHDGAVSGTMEVYDTHFCGYDMMMQTDSYLVPYSSSFVFETTEEKNSFSVDWISHYCSLNAIGVRHAVLSESGITAEGRNMSYILSASVEDGAYRSYEAVGNSEAAVTMELLDGSARIHAKASYQASLFDILCNQHYAVQCVSANTDYICNDALLQDVSDSTGRQNETGRQTVNAAEPFQNACDKILREMYLGITLPQSSGYCQ